MELWIRSQDRETLIKIENISIDNENYIIGNLISDDNKSICDYWRLGHYETKERALEVLDEIQNILQPKVIWKEPKTDIKYSEDFIQTLAQDMVIQTTQQVEYDLKQAGQIVYQMPKE